VIAISEEILRAHAYTSEAVSRAVRLGVRTIEHGNLIDEPTAKLMAQKGAYLVPTLVTYDAMARRGKEMGLPSESQAKNEEVRKAGLGSLDLAKRTGVPIGFGTDPLDPLHEDQSREFVIRSAVERPIDTLRSISPIVRP
jgi:imidazolonepropionase-like amidohydrolase